MPADPIASKLHRHFRTLEAKKTFKISAGCRKPKTHQLRESHILTLTLTLTLTHRYPLI
jgi:hypothetical protein